MSAVRSLSGGKQTWRGELNSAEIDPTETFDLAQLPSAWFDMMIFSAGEPFGQRARSTETGGHFGRRHRRLFIADGGR
jgi:hypothetical protein